MELTKFALLDDTANEALNTLYTNLSFAGSGVRKIMITSCRQAEGKSFVAMNAMRAFAGFGKSVVLVDADLRRSSIEDEYGVRMHGGKCRGLSHYLAGMSELDEVIYETNLKRAYMVPVGKRTSESLPLLHTCRLGQLLNMLSGHFDLVLVDTSPIGAVADAMEVAKSCDGALLVVSYGKTIRSEVREAKRMIERAGCTLLGGVLNHVDFHLYRNRQYSQKHDALDPRRAKPNFSPLKTPVREA